MAENLWTNSAFAKMLKEMNLTQYGNVKQVAARYIDTNEQLAQRVLELHEKATAWAKETPLASLFETQRTWAQQAIDTSATVARKLWQIEPKSKKATA